MGAAAAKDLMMQMTPMGPYVDLQSHLCSLQLQCCKLVVPSTVASRAPNIECGGFVA